MATALGVMPYVGVLFFSYDTLKKTYSGDERCATKLCRHNWHSAGSLGWPFPMLKYTHTHTHTHARARARAFNGPLSGTTQVSQYQKGKTNLDFTEARASEWQWHQLGHMQVCTSLQTDNHASTPPLSFLQAGCPSYHPTNSVKALKAITKFHCVISNAQILIYIF